MAQLESAFLQTGYADGPAFEAYCPLHRRPLHRPARTDCDDEHVGTTSRARNSRRVSTVHAKVSSYSDGHARSLCAASVHKKIASGCRLPRCARLTRCVKGTERMTTQRGLCATSHSDKSGRTPASLPGFELGAAER